jgi:putative peptide zinc metalloprotease protein
MNSSASIIACEPIPEQLDVAGSEVDLSTWGELAQSGDERRPELKLYLFRCHNGQFVRLTLSAYELLRLHVAKVDLADIAAKFGTNNGVAVSTAQLRDEHAKLVARIRAIAELPRRRKMFTFELQVLPERWVNYLAHRMTLLYRGWVAAPLMTAAMALVIFTVRSGRGAIGHTGTFAVGLGLAVAILLAHELGHATACKAFGANPSGIGIGFYLIFPAFYSDVSSAWQLNRWKRVVVDLGGTYFQLLATAVLAGLFLATGWSPLLAAIWMSIATAAFSLNPILKFDGYWVVADSLGVTNLSRQPARIAAHAWRRLKGIETEPLPWPAWVTACLIPYTVGALVFWLWFVWRLVPTILAICISYPITVVTLVRHLVARSLVPGELLRAALGTVTALSIALLLVRLGKRAFGLLLRRLGRPHSEIR